MTLSATAITEKNKVANKESLFLELLEVTVPGIDEPFRFVRNHNDNVTWRGETWTAFPCNISDIQDAPGEMPRVTLSVSNATRQMELLLHQYDYYCKVNGHEPILFNLYIVNSLNLASADPEVEHEFILKQPSATPEWVTFTLGASNPWDKRYPTRRMVPSCPWKFKQEMRINGVMTAACGYSGGATECNKTLTRCTELGNQRRFGGFFALGRLS